MATGLVRGGSHRAVLWQEAPAVVRRISALSSVSARALEFTILTVARTQESIFGKHTEVVNGIWIVPPERMKTGKEHRVPLPPRCLDILAETAQLGSEWMFPGASIRKPLSLSAMAECLKGLDVAGTVHGFRSTFSDWAGDATGFPEDLAEMALAHVIKNKSKAAYRRGDALEKRRKLMVAWERYLCQQTADVVQLRPALR